MTRLSVLISMVLVGGPAPQPVCDPKWKTTRGGCEYSMGASKGFQYGDIAVDPMEAVGLARCGERVTVCGKARVCVCEKPKMDGGT